ncbi:outer membrane protein-like protein [Anaeromyxobacter dehalogenans 2CP-C]|uniref:Outer membrane protein-like protein n=2 Tax=Anaeromyxobacter dehalogenans TaxID=161493 RepID=Q2IGB4_ANADE|nr:outer membrane protein-like protein [Anaeromyxobacter dehalogenans 2CP-C]
MPRRAGRGRTRPAMMPSSVLLLSLLVVAGPVPPASPQFHEAPPHRMAPLAPERVYAITFDEALGLAAEAPSVAGAERAVSVKSEGNSKIGLLTSNPSLVLQPGFSTRDANPRLEGEVALTQSFNLAGLSGNRRKAARTEEQQLRDEARAVALSRRLDAAQAWLDMWAAEAAFQLSREELGLAMDLAARTRRAAEAAALTRADAADADAYEAEARLASLSVEGEVTDLGFRLAEMVGRATPLPMTTSGELPMATVPERAAWPALIARAAALPAARAEKLAAEADRARASEARSARGLDLQLGARAQRDSAGNDVLYGIVGFTFPVFERGHREAATFDAAAARRAGEAEDASRRAVTELARAFHEVEHTGEVLDALEKTLVPAAAESARLREAAMRAGDATVVEVLVARRSAASARARELRARAAHAWARAKVAMLVALVPTDGAPPTARPSTSAVPAAPPTLRVSGAQGEGDGQTSADAAARPSTSAVPSAPPTLRVSGSPSPDGRDPEPSQPRSTGVTP